eukprot:866317-Ditylum_brightwellii.AAC.1
MHGQGQEGRVLCHGKAFKKASFKSKKAHKRLYHNSSESDSSLGEESYSFKLNLLGDNSLTKLKHNVNQ